MRRREGGRMRQREGAAINLGRVGCIFMGSAWRLDN